MKKIVLLTVLIVIFGIIINWTRQPSGPAAAAPTGLIGSSRLPELLGEEGITGYAKATDPRIFSFPDDHGPHPPYRNEWWYVTGNLDAENGGRFGFELTIFRFSLTPGTESARSRASAWATNQVYIGHFAITDVDGEQFHVAQRYSRGALGLAGARASPFRVWLEDWFIAESPADAGSGADAFRWHAHAADKNNAIELSLNALKPPVLHGNNGLSQKSSQAGNASYYYSVSRLRADGILRLDEHDYAVSGLAWLDREWGSSALSGEQQGWDWFALQLSDGSDLMFYNLRRNDGRQDIHSAGTWIGADGRILALSRDDIAIEVQDYWDSPHGGRYPMRWQIRVSPLALDLHVNPVLKAQELSTNVRYWEGAVDVNGRRDGAAITGRGYVELTGYASASSPASP